MIFFVDIDITTGKPTYAECQDLCRVQNLEHSAKLLFAECQKTCTRRTTGTRRPISLPSASQMALGKDTLCQVPVSWHSAKSVTCTAPTRRRPLRWGLLLFAECLQGDTRQIDLCRVPHSRHSANSVTCPAHAVATNVPIFPRPLPLLFAECQLGNTRQKHASPSVSLGHSANIL